MTTLVRRKLTRSSLFSSFNNINTELKIVKEKVSLLPEKSDSKMTIVFDLDETLIHTHLEANNLGDDLITIEIQGKKYFTSVRPGVRQFLKGLVGEYELVLFTASTEAYANQIIGDLERDGPIFDHKLFCRNCKEKFGQLFKDVTRLGRDLSKTVVFDDCLSVWTTVDNLYICKRYTGGNDDDGVKVMENVIKEASKLNDVRNAIRKTSASCEF